MSKRMEKFEEAAKNMSDESLLNNILNAWLALFANGLLGHHPKYSADGDVASPWQEFTAYKREIHRRMSGKK